MLKFRYYIYYCNYHYVLYDRKKYKIHYECLSFRDLYLYLKKHKYNFNDIHIKSISLHEFFRDYCYFDEENEKL